MYVCILCVNMDTRSLKCAEIYMINMETSIIYIHTYIHRQIDTYVTNICTGVTLCPNFLAQLAAISCRISKKKASERPSQYLQII